MIWLCKLLHFETAAKVMTEKFAVASRWIHIPKMCQNAALIFLDRKLHVYSVPKKMPASLGYKTIHEWLRWFSGIQPENVFEIFFIIDTLCVRWDKNKAVDHQLFNDNNTAWTKCYQSLIELHASCNLNMNAVAVWWQMFFLENCFLQAK